MSIGIFLVRKFSTKLWRPTLYEDRQPTKDLITGNQIPHTAVAELGGVFRSEVSRYVGNKKVTDRDRIRIEQTVTEISDLVQVMREHFGLRPDLRDIPALRAAIAELKSARAYNSAQAQLKEAEKEVATALREIASAT
jgi:predicted transcriptional regulator